MSLVALAAGAAHAQCTGYGTGQEALQLLIGWWEPDDDPPFTGPQGVWHSSPSGDLSGQFEFAIMGSWTDIVSVEFATRGPGEPEAVGTTYSNAVVDVWQYAAGPNGPRVPVAWIWHSGPAWSFRRDGMPDGAWEVRCRVTRLGTTGGGTSLPGQPPPPPGGTQTVTPLTGGFNVKDLSIDPDGMSAAAVGTDASNVAVVPPFVVVRQERTSVELSFSFTDGAETEGWYPTIADEDRTAVNLELTPIAQEPSADPAPAGASLRATVTGTGNGASATLVGVEPGLYYASATVTQPAPLVPQPAFSVAVLSEEASYLSAAEVLDSVEKLYAEGIGVRTAELQYEVRLAGSVESSLGVGRTPGTGDLIQFSPPMPGIAPPSIVPGTLTDTFPTAGDYAYGVAYTDDGTADRNHDARWCVPKGFVHWVPPVTCFYGDGDPVFSIDAGYAYAQFGDVWTPPVIGGTPMERTFYSGRVRGDLPIGVVPKSVATCADFLYSLDHDAVVYYTGHITGVTNAQNEDTDLYYVFGDGTVNAEDIEAGGDMSQARLVYLASCDSAMWLDYGPPAPEHVYRPSLMEACTRKGARAAIGYSGLIESFASHFLDTRCLPYMTKHGHGASLAVALSKVDFIAAYGYLGQGFLDWSGYQCMRAKPDGTNATVWPATFAE